MPHRPHLLAAALTAAALAVPSHAIQPQVWTHSTEADFEEGETDGVVVTNLGDLKLATSAEAVGELPEGVSVIYDLVKWSGRGDRDKDVIALGSILFLAVGPEGRVLMFRDGKYEEVASFEGEQVFTLAMDLQDRLLIGVSGERSRVMRITELGEEPETVAVLPDERYVWDLLPIEGGALYVATGPEGRVYRFDELEAMTEEEVAAATQPAATQPAATQAAGEGVEEGEEVGEAEADDAELPEHVVLDTAQANVLCLAAGPDGAVYAGTDTEGLIYRLTDDGGVFIVYDAAEPEIGALAVARDGTVYAGTADAEQARPGRMGEAAGEELGRPAASQPGGVEIEIEVDPGNPGEPGDPAEPGEPLPVEPDPQPLQTGEMDDAPAPEAPEGEAAPDATADDGVSADDGAADAAEAEGDAAAPTPEQYDALREEIRERLVQARTSGSIAGKAAVRASSRPTRAAREATAADDGAALPGGPGATPCTALTRRGSCPRSSASR